MAFKIDYTLKIIYSYGRNDSNYLYTRILTDSQKEELLNLTEKTFTVKDTYHKIDLLNGTKELINITMGIYDNENRDTLIESKKYFFVPDVNVGAENFIKQGYEYLKTLPEYENVIDC